jgi:hypothetical protein
MWQVLVKAVQIAIFLAVVVWGLSDPTLPQNGIALGIMAIMVVAVVTVAPWLVFKMVEQAAQDLRLYRASKSGRRGDPVVLEFLDNPVPRRRIASNRSLSRHE